MNPKNTLAKIKQRSTLAAKGAFVGAFVGGIFGRKPASVGAALGASFGVLLADKKNVATTHHAALSEKKQQITEREQTAPESE